MHGVEPKNGTLVYVDGEVKTMQDMLTIPNFVLKMTGIPLILGKIPKEPTLKFAKRLSILQGTHNCNPPLHSFAHCQQAGPSIPTAVLRGL